MKYEFLIIWLSLKWIRRVQPGDLIFAAGEKWIVRQANYNASGVLAYPIRRLAGGYETGEHRRFFTKAEYRKLYSLRGMYQSFRSGIRFYRGYWLDIWKRNGIEPWMRGSNIWGDR